MQIIILAAGEGKRLRPLTNDRPKCMVKFGKISLVDRMISNLMQLGIQKSQVHIITGYMGNKLDYLGINMIHNPNFDSTNMVYSLMCARDVLNCGDDILILYSDIIMSQYNYKRIIEQTEGIRVPSNNNWEKLWRLRMENPINDLESFKFNDKGELLEIGKKIGDLNELDGQFMGVITLNRNIAPHLVKAFESLSEGCITKKRDLDNIYMTEFIQYLITSGITIHVDKLNGGWLEVDTISDLESYEKMLTNCGIDWDA